jgi:hypothetical protein
MVVMDSFTLQSSGGGLMEDDDEQLPEMVDTTPGKQETEMKMLESSLIRQTKELEQAKIALEEAKLQLATLRQHQHQRQWSVMGLMFGGVNEEINGLKAKLRASAQAEERSQKAADDLAAALSAVTMEAKQVKGWLADAQAELERANAEAGRLRELLQEAEAELWATTERADALTAENAALRRALESAVDEANAAGESLDLATAENARLQDAVAEKEAARRENEALKTSEELQEAQLAVSLAARKETPTDGGADGKKATTELPLQKWATGDAVQGKLSAEAFLDSGRVVATGRKFASLSNLTELKSAAAAAAAMDDYSYEFDHFDVAGQYGNPDDAVKRHKKRRPILTKFGDLFRWRSMYKSNLAPVLHRY